MAVISSAISAAAIVILLCKMVKPSTKTTKSTVAYGHDKTSPAPAVYDNVVAVQSNTAHVDVQCNVAYGCVGGGTSPSVPADYEAPITTTVDVQSNVAYGHVSTNGAKMVTTAVYESITN